MKIGKLLGIVCVIAMVAGLLVAGCAGEAPPTEGPPTEGPPTEGPPEEEVYNLTMCVQHPAVDTMVSQVLAGWYNWLDEESNGRIKFETIVSAGCAAPPDIYDAARGGLVDIGCQSYGENPGAFPLQEVANLPILFPWPNARTASMVTSALYEKYPEMQAEHPDVKVINFHSTSASFPSFTKKDVRTLEDYQGLVVEEFGAYGVDATEALGGTPARMPILEAYDALAKGTLDGIDANWTALFIFSWVDSLNYCIQVPTIVNCFIHVMNLNTYNSLPPDLQALFDESYWVLPELFGYQFDKEEALNRAAYEDILVSRGLPGIYIPSDEELARWEEAVQPVYENWVQQAAAIVGEAKARAILEDAKMFAEEYRYETTPFDWCEETLHDWGAPAYQ